MINKTIIILLKNEIFKNSEIDGRALFVIDLKKVLKKEKSFTLKKIWLHNCNQTSKLTDLFSLKAKYTRKNYALAKGSNKKQSP
jgi:fructose-specific component phosphotransferase system IIB-like protein